MQAELEEGSWMLIPVEMTVIVVLAIFVSTELALKRNRDFTPHGVRKLSSFFNIFLITNILFITFSLPCMRFYMTAYLEYDERSSIGCSTSVICFPINWEVT